MIRAKMPNKKFEIPSIEFHLWKVDNCIKLPKNVFTDSNNKKIKSFIDHQSRFDSDDGNWIWIY